MQSPKGVEGLGLASDAFGNLAAALRVHNSPASIRINYNPRTEESPSTKYDS